MGQIAQLTSNIAPPTICYDRVARVLHFSAFNIASCVASSIIIIVVIEYMVQIVLYNCSRRAAGGM